MASIFNVFKYLLIVVIIKCSSSEMLFNDKDIAIILRVINKCENYTSKYSCLANKAAIAMERISNEDVPLFNGIVLKKQHEDYFVNKTARSINGISKLRQVLLKFLNSHVLSLDLTRDNEEEHNEERAVGEGRRRNKFKISRKEKRHFWYSMVVLLGIFGLTGPLIMKTLTIIAGKALIASKIALLMVGSVALKKIFAQNNSNDVKVHTHTVPIYDEHDRLYNIEQDSNFVHHNSLLY